MKTIPLIIAFAISGLGLVAQQTSIPDAQLRDLNGTIVTSHQAISPGQATLLVFWKSSSGKCCENLDNINDAWIESLRMKGVRLVAICVDCNGSWTHVKPIVDGNSWDFETFIDVNGEFKRAMNVGEAPCTLLFDQDNTLLCRYNSGCTGSQEFICANILDHLAGEVIAYEFQAGK